LCENVCVLHEPDLKGNEEWSISIRTECSMYTLPINVLCGQMVAPKLRGVDCIFPYVLFFSTYPSFLVAWGVLGSNRFRSRSSLTICGIFVAHSSACHPSSIRSSISSLYFSFFITFCCGGKPFCHHLVPPLTDVCFVSKNPFSVVSSVGRKR